MKRVKESSKVAMLIAMFAITFTSTAFAQEKGTFTDPRDKKKYSTVKIGEQTWMAENLSYNAKGSKCYDKDPANCTKYGKLYDWATAMGLASTCNVNICVKQIKAKHTGICPKGWYLPSDKDWDKLYRFADSTSGAESPYRSETAGKYLKSKEGWKDDYKGKSGNGEDKFGFSALPGGTSYYSVGRGGGSGGENFDYVGRRGYWWSSSESEYAGASSFSRFMEEDKASYTSANKDGFYSVRCMQD
ncbi:MAG: hypothetical protein LBH25_09375 [Fibromonadaceae bacterium]|jgi:uncharacterized protein (TIGR02145 family)|nr:hypothetical protein [Fibromonadaceae bacterium]